MGPVMRYDEAVALLFQVPLDQFVTERKRLAGELKAAGDRDGAARLAKLARPPTSAWVVNQLWWHARGAFDALFETARQLRDGQLEAAAAHRDALGKLRGQAANILTDAGHGATEATLRRVALTLSALAAAGGWEPDLPGTLSADRDPPGFEAFGAGSFLAPPAASAAPATRAPGLVARSPGPVARSPGATEAAEAVDAAGVTEAAEAEPDEVTARALRVAAEARARERKAAVARAEAAAALRRAEAERAQRAAERHRLEAALRTAQGDVAQREREVARLERDLVVARAMVEQARAVAEDLEARLAQLDGQRGELGP